MSVKSSIRWYLFQRHKVTNNFWITKHWKPPGGGLSLRGGSGDSILAVLRIEWDALDIGGTVGEFTDSEREGYGAVRSEDVIAEQVWAVGEPRIGEEWAEAFGAFVAEGVVGDVTEVFLFDFVGWCNHNELF